MFSTEQSSNDIIETDKGLVRSKEPFFHVIRSSSPIQKSNIRYFLGTFLRRHLVKWGQLFKSSDIEDQIQPYFCYYQELAAFLQKGTLHQLQCNNFSPHRSPPLVRPWMSP